MTKVKPPIGSYNIQGDKLIPDQDGLPVFIKFKRRKPLGKPPHYLMVGRYGNAETYFSSMFPTDEEGVYTLERDKVYYTLTMTADGKASITLKKGKRCA
jgi:hypothetical protein